MRDFSTYFDRYPYSGYEKADVVANRNVCVFPRGTAKFDTGLLADPAKDYDTLYELSDGLPERAVNIKVEKRLDRKVVLVLENESGRPLTIRKGQKLLCFWLGRYKYRLPRPKSIDEMLRETINTH